MTGYASDNASATYHNMLINYLLVMQSTQAWLSSCPAVQESLFRTGEQEVLECSGVLLEQQTTTTKTNEGSKHISNTAAVSIIAKYI